MDHISVEYKCCFKIFEQGMPQGTPGSPWFDIWSRGTLNVISAKLVGGYDMFLIFRSSKVQFDAILDTYEHPNLAALKQF